MSPGLNAGLEAPDLPIERLPLMGQPERRKVLEEWNATSTPEHDPIAVHEMISTQARRAPQAMAVVTRDATLTYDLLERRANQLAHYLRAQGMGPESVVAIHLDRSPDLLAAVLGVLKAGAGFFLLDPGVAPERTRLMLEDAGAGMLTVEALAADLSTASRRVWALDALDGVIGSQSHEPPPVRCQDDNVAWVNFTSGSTGRPRGVVVTHGALRNHLRWRVAHIAFTPDDRTLHSAPLGSEDAVWQLLAPLVA